jgi:hypothetical protein
MLVGQDYTDYDKQGPVLEELEEILRMLKNGDLRFLWQ